MAEFPSPYGVLFILIKNKIEKEIIFKIKKRFRLLTEYYSFLLKIK